MSLELPPGSEEAVAGLIVAVILLIVKWSIRLIRYMCTIAPMEVLGGGVLVIINIDGVAHLAIVKPDWKREWEEFGGRAELGESGSDAAIRELSEEGGEWLESIGCSEYTDIGCWTVRMKINGSKEYRSTTAAMLLSTSLTRAQALACSTRKYQDRGYKVRREVSVDFIPVEDLNYRHGYHYVGFGHDGIKLSARLRRMLKDRRIITSLAEAASMHCDSSGDMDGILILAAPNRQQS
jgi:hypothetical protein